MYSVKSLSHRTVRGHQVFTIESPVACERSLTGLQEALGNEIEIDGKACTCIAVEMKMPGGQIAIGEKIEVMTSREEEDDNEHEDSEKSTTRKV